MACNAVSYSDPVLSCGSTVTRNHGFYLHGLPAHPDESLKPEHMSQGYTGQLHTGQHDDVINGDQPVGDWSTGSMESMEWRQHLHVDDEEDLVVSIEQRCSDAIKEQRSNCSLALQHCFLDRVYRSQNEEHSRKVLVAQIPGSRKDQVPMSRVKLVLIRKWCSEVGPQKILMKKFNWPANIEADELLAGQTALNPVPVYKVVQEVKSTIAAVQEV